ncbi:Branched-chain amino acid transport system permease protein LivM (plasmid) [Sinorhizobium sojae CCBAU 05684]|uniref:Branched-chain amino acid transport system permease protein LivM n=1 Tax=Sinorhizobium sojae CCBAU 05684 TaxID=716928 RepID=A0A249PMC0_9HYPH|nr:branched-chain amino acid ABC transporter permease [Sinorhizobium sojae]ASY66824.1 Branched-chain amino acid transport system permease protein LivM [Sinorhizobium sojae CCBAU 05684]
MKDRVSPLLIVVVVAVLALVPLAVEDYGLGLAIGAMGYIALASSWALFSGPTRYISLATVAFFGFGSYTVAVLGDYLPFLLILAIAALIGLFASFVVGFATLRLAGIYFVVFSFGLAEMVRQLLTWYEVNVTGTLGRYIFVDVDGFDIYYMLLAVAVAALAIRWWIDRGRLGLAVRAIGDDEAVARHAGVDVTRVKLALFAMSSVLITLVGAIQAPRWTYVEPSIVFNPTISFLTVIMALLGGASRLWGPVFGAAPLFFLFEWLSGRFPDHYSIILGLLFIGIVFLFPEGVLARIEEFLNRVRAQRTRAAKEVPNERLA